MVHVDTPPDTCREWNRQRGAAEGYTEPIFEDLAGRFERPDSRNRWDAPLFTVRPAAGEAQAREHLEAAAAAVGDAPPRPQQQQQTAAAAAGLQQRQQEHQQQQQLGAAGGMEEPGGYDDGPQPLRLAKELKPHVATDTTHSKLAATNLQHDIDRALQQVVECVAEAQAAAGSGAPGVVTFPPLAGGGDGSLPALDMYRPVSTAVRTACCVKTQLQQQQRGYSACPCAGFPPCFVYRNFTFFMLLCEPDPKPPSPPRPLSPFHDPPQMFLPELRRHKRAAMRLATSQTFSRMRDAAAAQRLFISYLRDQLAQA
jgi:hypothetical protein